MSDRAAEIVATAALVVTALAIAIVSARPIVESWNDGSRLATIESLVERHTFAIDESVFARPADGAAAAAALLVPTRDKVLVGGRFYSDKPPVPALLLAAPYQLWRWGGGRSAAQDPGGFAWWMTLASAGLAYVVAVLALFRAGRVLQVARRDRLLLAASFALATLALPYARAVNAHEMLLGVAAAAFALLAGAPADGGWSRGRLLAVGALGGLGYALELAAGPLLLACVGVYVAARTRSAGALRGLAAGALPWMLLHHAITYAIGGTLRPINAVPQYLAWPGSPFGADMTGVIPQSGVAHGVAYGLALLVGPRGFLGSNPTLYVALAGVAALWGRPPREAALLACGAAWSVATWLTYATLSTNYSGECASIRWFVPLLAPAYLLLAVLLREQPGWRQMIAAVSLLGALLALPTWWWGPWVRVPGWRYWPVQAAIIVVAWRQARALRGVAHSTMERVGS